MDLLTHAQVNTAFSFLSVEDSYSTASIGRGHGGISVNQRKKRTLQKCIRCLLDKNLKLLFHILEYLSALKTLSSPVTYFVIIRFQYFWKFLLLYRIFHFSKVFSKIWICLQVKFVIFIGNSFFQSLIQMSQCFVVPRGASFSCAHRFNVSSL